MFKKKIGFGLLVIVLLSCVSLIHSEEADKSLVGYWRFDKGRGDRARDSSGKGNDGKIYGAKWVKTGKGNFALKFDGVDDYVDCGNDASFDITDAITIEAWIKWEDFGTDGRSYQIVSKRIPETSEVNYQLGLFRPSASVDSYLEFCFSDGGFRSVKSTDNIIVVGEWYHLAATFDSAKDTVKVFIDGAVDSESATGLSLHTNKAPVQIGIFGKNYPFNGFIDEVKIYNRCLTPEEIKSHYKQERDKYRGPITVAGNEPFSITLTGSLREEISLRGEWDFMKVKGDLTYPPEGTWEKIKIPPRWTSGAGRDVSTIYRKYWYHRLFTIPDDAQGKRIKIKFMAVFYDARVYVNGKYAGSHFGGFTPFVIDITDLVKIGQTNELYVGIKDWTSASTKEVGLLNGAEPSHDEIKNAVDKYSFIAPIGCHPAGGPDGIWQDVLLLVRPKVHVEDVFVITSFRNSDIRLQFTLRNEDSVSHTVKIENSVSDKEGIAKQLRERAVTIRPDSEATIEIKEGWTDPKLWNLDSPHLYNLLTTISENGKTIDRKNH